MSPEHIRHHSNIVITHGDIIAEFYKASHGYYCDVFVSGVALGEGFAIERRQALKEALHSAMDRVVHKIFGLPDNIDTVPAPPPRKKD